MQFETASLHIFVIIFKIKHKLCKVLGSHPVKNNGVETVASMY